MEAIGTPDQVSPASRLRVTVTGGIDRAQTYAFHRSAGERFLFVRERFSLPVDRGPVAPLRIRLELADPEGRQRRGRS